MSAQAQTQMNYIWKEKQIILGNHWEIMMKRGNPIRLEMSQWHNLKNMDKKSKYGIFCGTAIIKPCKNSQVLPNY
jgi:hypothetical protein